MYNPTENSSHCEDPFCIAEVPVEQTHLSAINFAVNGDKVPLKSLGRIQEMSIDDGLVLDSYKKGTPCYIICRPPDAAKFVNKVKQIQTAAIYIGIPLSLIIVSVSQPFIEDVTTNLYLFMAIYVPQILAQLFFSLQILVCDWKLRQKKYNPSGYTYQGKRLYRNEKHPHYFEHVNMQTKEIRIKLYPDEIQSINTCQQS